MKTHIRFERENKPSPVPPARRWAYTDYIYIFIFILYI
jgi:hypothetical protein